MTERISPRPRGALSAQFCGDNFRSRVFYRLVELADVPRFRFQDIRHTFAGLLLSQGESVNFEEQMGHASIQTTVDFCGHFVPGSNRYAVDRLDDLDDMPLKVVSAEAVC